MLSEIIVSIRDFNNPILKEHSKSKSVPLLYCLLLNLDELGINRIVTNLVFNCAAI